MGLILRVVCSCVSGLLGVFFVFLRLSVCVRVCVCVRAWHASCFQFVSFFLYFVTFLQFFFFFICFFVILFCCERRGPKGEEPKIFEYLNVLGSVSDQTLQFHKDGDNCKNAKKSPKLETWKNERNDNTSNEFSLFIFVFRSFSFHFLRFLSYFLFLWYFSSSVVLLSGPSFLVVLFFPSSFFGCFVALRHVLLGAVFLFLLWVVPLSPFLSCGVLTSFCCGVVFLCFFECCAAVPAFSSYSHLT